MVRSIVQVGVSPSGIGMAWLRAIGDSAEWTLAGIVDLDADHRHRAAEHHGLPLDRCFATVGAALAAVEAEAVAIAVPPAFHAPLCAEALRAGRHVVVEKPFTVDFADAAALATLADHRGVRLMVSQNYRYLGVIRALRRTLAEGTIGRPEHVSVSFHCLWPPRPYQRSLADPILLEMGTHHIDSLRFVLGMEAAIVAGRTWRPRWTSYGGDTWVDCTMTFGPDLHVTYQGSLESPGLRSPWPGLWRIVGESGALHLDDLGEGYGVYLSRDHELVEKLADIGGGGVDPGAAIAGTLEEFAMALREGRRPLTDARDNLRTLAVAHAISRSSAEGRAVDVEREFFDSASHS